MPSFHPRCTQHGLVAPDGMCVLCRKQASSAPPAQKPQPGTHAPLPTVDASQRSADKFAALLVGVALVSIAATYVVESITLPETTAASEQGERRRTEIERAQASLLAALEAEEPPDSAPAEQEQKPDGHENSQ